jgi:hypothetical protein
MEEKMKEGNALEMKKKISQRQARGSSPSAADLVGMPVRAGAEL